jgi:hypothetical protein
MKTSPRCGSKKWWSLSTGQIRCSQCDQTRKVSKNGIEGFWFFAKHWLYQCQGIPKAYFPLYLKEVERRFNYRQEKMVILLRKLLNQQISIVKK